LVVEVSLASCFFSLGLFFPGLFFSLSALPFFPAQRLQVCFSHHAALDGCSSFLSFSLQLLLIDLHGPFLEFDQLEAPCYVPYVISFFFLHASRSFSFFDIAPGRFPFFAKDRRVSGLRFRGHGRACPFSPSFFLSFSTTFVFSAEKGRRIPSRRREARISAGLPSSPC